MLNSSNMFDGLHSQPLWTQLVRQNLKSDCVDSLIGMQTMLESKTKIAKPDVKQYLSVLKYKDVQRLQYEMDRQMEGKPDNYDRIDAFIDKLKQKHKP